MSRLVLVTRVSKAASTAVYSGFMGTSAIHSRAGFVFLFLLQSDGKRKCCLSESHLNTVLRFILSIQSWDSADNTCKHKHTHQTQVLLAGSESAGYT